jgi:two-component system phosphate regulon sensor histidine kinase PhoR
MNPAAEAAYEVEAADLLGTRLDETPCFQSLVSLAQWVITSGDSAREQAVMPSGESRWIHLLVTPEAPPSAPRLPLGKRSGDAGAVDPMREMVHDLKVRIASADGFLNLVETLGGLNDGQLKFMQRAHQSLTAMLNQVHEMLDVSWLETGGELTLGQMDLSRLVRHAATLVEGYARDCNVEISLDLPPEGCTVDGDERRLLSAVGNLIGNAIKYSPNGGPVNLVLEANTSTATLRVIDHGIGIPAECLPRLFERFYRVRAPETQRIEGTGLGLAIVKAIVEKHGGQVFVESTPGAGSVFGFTLPLF